MQIGLFEASKTVEGIYDKQIRLWMDVRLLLQGLVDKIDNFYTWLGTSSDQERAISAGNQLNDQVSSVVNILKGGEKQGEVDLF